MKKQLPSHGNGYAPERSRESDDGFAPSAYGRASRPAAAAWAAPILWVPMLAVVLLLAPMLGSMPANLSADPNPFEIQDIEARAKESYKRFIKLWQEELYFELYDLGIQSTRDRITREQFAQRMVELAWVPDGALNEKYLIATMRFRTMVYVKARVLYRGKFNPDMRFSKDLSVLLLFERGRWRLDLIQLIRSPYTT